jgi:hypothetical protein
MIASTVRAPASHTVVFYRHEGDRSHIDLLHDPGHGCTRFQMVPTSGTKVNEVEVGFFAELLGREQWTFMTWVARLATGNAGTAVSAAG